MSTSANPSITICPAVAAEQPIIEAIVRAANINRSGLDWQRFLVADADGQVVGIGQVKPHPDGSRELASIAVIPERQRQGIAHQVIKALLAREHEPLYLMCRSEMSPFYVQFGFQLITRSQMPPYFRRIARLTGFITPIISLITRETLRVSIMKQVDSP